MEETVKKKEDKTTGEREMRTKYWDKENEESKGI